MEKPAITEKDIKTALGIFQRAIEFFKIPDEQTQENAKEFIREDGTLDLEKIPLVVIRTWDNGTKFLNLTYFYDGFLTVYADYNPIPAILDFLDSARKHLKVRFPEAKDDEIEQWAEREASRMSLILFSRIYPRMNLAMQNFTDEVIHNWLIEWRRWEAKFNSEHGIKSEPFSEKKFFRGLLKIYENDLVNLWFNVPNRTLDEKKMQLAKEYPSILNHWQKLRKEYVKNPDWQEYAKAGKFFDTPDDLIDMLEDCLNISYLAIEHAGRRAGLLNPDAKEEDLEKRQQQIKVTGYTPRQLRNLKDEGEKLLSEMQT